MRKFISLIFTLALVLESAGAIFSTPGKPGKGRWSGNKYVQIREVTPKKAAKPAVKSAKKPAKPSSKSDTNVKTSSSKRSSSPGYRTGSGTRKYKRTVRRPYRTRRYYHRTAKVYTDKKPQAQPVNLTPKLLGFTGTISSYDVGGRTIMMSSDNRLIKVSVPRDVDVRMPGYGFIDISEIPGNAKVKVKGIRTGASTVEARFVEVWGGRLREELRS